MKPNERLLEAINDLDEDFITDALTRPQTTHRNRVRILVLAAALAACLTACGIHSLSVWYQEYFAGQSEGKLNREQKNYLEENVAAVTPPDIGSGPGRTGTDHRVRPHRRHSDLHEAPGRCGGGGNPVRR